MAETLGQKVRIIIKDLKVNEVSILILPSNTVLEVKAMAEHQWGIPLAMQRYSVLNCEDGQEAVISEENLIKVMAAHYSLFLTLGGPLEVGHIRNRSYARAVIFLESGTATVAYMMVRSFSLAKNSIISHYTRT